ncbi:MAG: sodium-dependent transporter [Chloroflexi bacterium]|nr:sodium-dependent transporter [Chloroflexota bacterium]
MSEEVRKGREGFATGLGVLAATLGSAVGLGNIWKFPSLTGTNGGAAFIFIYIISTLLVGLEVMISEHIIGRTTRKNAIDSLRSLAPRQVWWLIGAAGVLSAFLIMAFYTEVAAWVFAYIPRAISSALNTTDPAVSEKAFADLINSPWQSLIWQWVVLIWVAAIIIAGVSKGIEAMTKRLLPILFGILVIINIRSLTLPGAAEGLSFLFKPNWSAVTWMTVLTAVGLSFFKLSVGMGTMITYGSYFRDDENIPATGVRVMLSDLLVSLLAGMAIFPTVFTYGFAPDAGPSLLFITMPAVFSSLPGGPFVQNLFMVLFFLLAGIAATGAMLSLFEVPVAYLVERLGWSRRKATISTALGLALVGSTAALSNSLMANFKIAGKTMFDLFDFATSNVLLPVGGLFICLFVGWRWGYAALEKNLTNNGTLNNRAVVRAFYFLVKWVTPVLLVVVLLNGLGIIKLG